MLATLITFGAIAVIELLLYVRLLWPVRKWVASGLVLAQAISSGLWLGSHLSALAVLIASLTIYRAINLLRLVEGRSTVNYLRRAALKTSLWVIGAQIVVIAVGEALKNQHVHIMAYAYTLTLLSLMALTGLLLATLRTARTIRPGSIDAGIASRDLPSLTVAIPARNETTDLEACLQSLLQSNYPKLEILVLDDCSQNRHTPEIIRGFAHEGVRFVAGEVPPDEWLAKNYAYEQLTREASGDIILFCGVDVRFEADTLTTMVKLLLQKQKSMISFMPRNQALPGRPLAMLAQVNRYAWELVLPRRRFDRPPVLSTCWLITAKLLSEAGGFGAVRHSVQPERYFARYATAHADSYSFLQASGDVKLSSEKAAAEQFATAVRVRYPELHRRLELVALVTMLELALFLTPVVTLIVGIVSNHWLLSVIALLSLILANYLYVRVSGLTYQAFRWGSLCSLGIGLAYDIALLNYSMWQYEFREVIWKQRNVCIPLMQVEAELPKLP